MSRYLITSDLHLTSKPADAYRFDLFPWLVTEAQKHRVEVVFILGDLTDAKDRHPASLVQRIVSSIQLLTGHGLKVVILKGNHDYTDPSTPFFGFLGELENVLYVTEPMEIDKDWCGATRGIACVPHAREPIDWKKVGKAYSHVDYLFLHHTFGGVTASNGQVLPGDDPAPLSQIGGFTISGDIHVPQKIGVVKYVGSPYTIRFNDAFEPRVLLEGMQVGPEDLHFPCLVRRKIEITCLEDLMRSEVRAGDQIKVKYKISRDQVRELRSLRGEVREFAEDVGCVLCGLEIEIESSDEMLEQESSEAVERSPEEIVRLYGERERLTEDRIQVGVGLVKDEGELSR